MQNRKEDFIEFLKTIKKEVHEWESRHLWTTRIFVYGGLLLLVIFVGAILFANFNLFHTDVTSARYMLSAVVQTQSAIIAIVITLTLIAVQLTASAYSPRVIDIFKKNPDMWILLGCYGVSIFYGFLILKLVDGTEGEVVSQSAIWSLGPISISFEFCVSLAYWLGAFTFVALFPYMWNIICLLKSENIIKRLAIEITKGKILNLKEDPVQPIVDIIHGSIIKYDFETTRVGLKTVTDQVLKIISSNDEKTISKHFCNHLTRVGRLAISREDVESTVEVINNLEKFWKSTVERGLKSVTLQAVESLEVVGKTAGEKGLDDAPRDAAMSLALLAGKAAAKGWREDIASSGVKSLIIVVRDRLRSDLIVESLAVVGKDAAEKGLGDATAGVAMAIEVVGRVAVKEGFKVPTKRAAESLGEVGKAAAEKRFEDAKRQAAESLAKLTILSEEIVKSAIQDYESKLEEQDRDSFQEFMKIYEQKLKELRAENQNKKTESN